MDEIQKSEKRNSCRLENFPFSKEMKNFNFCKCTKIKRQLLLPFYFLVIDISSVTYRQCKDN